MPKFLLGNVVVKTFEVWASSEEEAEEFILKWQTSEAEEPEGGIKATRYAMSWSESSLIVPTEPRDKILAEFLRLMQEVIPGMPKEEPRKIITLDQVKHL